MAIKPQRQLFIRLYMRDHNGARAARDAGYAPKNAGKQARVILGDPGVRAEVERLEQQLAEQADVDAQWVLAQSVEIVRSCMETVPETGRLVDAGNANRALDRIARYTGGFSEQVEHSGPEGRPIPFLAMVVKMTDEELIALHRRVLGDGSAGT